MPKAHADAILKDIWQDRGLPVDSVWIAKRMGIDVVDAPLSDIDANIAGALFKKKEGDPVIILNKGDSDQRKRFTCAHEIGHYIKRTDEGNLEYEFVDLRSALSHEGVDEEEIFANQFAANLLMPEGTVRGLHKLKKTVIEMSIFFNVSADAIYFRLKNLRLK